MKWGARRLGGGGKRGRVVTASRLGAWVRARKQEQMSEVYPDYPDVVLATVVIDCVEPERVALFWSKLLGRQIVVNSDTWIGLEWSPRFGAGLCFQRTSQPKTGKNRLHVDLLCADIPATAAYVVELGGQCAAGYNNPPVVVMLDPEQNEFCLVPKPGSA